MRSKRLDSVKTCVELLKEYEEKNTEHKPSKKLNFSGVDTRDVYNITAPFMDNGKLTIAGRIENRDDELSEVGFFQYDEGTWVLRGDKDTYKKLQDPFFTNIHGELIIGGIEVFTGPADEKKIVSWRTNFYRGKSTDQLKLFAKGPSHMKDIRLVELNDGSIGVFSRPQGEIGGKGQIGFIRINSLDELNEETILKAHIFEDQFVKEEWGGSNEPYILKNGLIGVLGHVAYSDKDRTKHYYAMTFALNPDTLEKTPIKIIAARKGFVQGPYKRRDTEDVIFSGGMQRSEDGSAVLYAGVSDCEAHSLVISDPFLEYEE